jgi:ABC-type transport system involved in multi-copper enzyme maturation permease subunit
MFWNVLHMESYKFFRRRMLWLGLGIALLPGLIFFCVAFYAARHVIAGAYLTWPGGIAEMLAYANGFSGGTGYAVYLLAIVVGLLTTREYSCRTMQLWLGSGVPRPLLLAAKFVIALAATLCVSLGFLLAGAVVSLIFTYQLHGAISVSASDIALALLSSLRTAYAMLPYVALALLCSIIFRSPAAVGVVPLFMLAVELPLSFILPALGPNFAHAARYLPSGLAQTMSMQNFSAAHLAAETIGGGGQADPLIAALCIAIYTLVLCGTALWIFQRQDLAN